MRLRLGWAGCAQNCLLDVGRGVAVGHEERQVAGVGGAGATPGVGDPGVFVGGEYEPEGDDEARASVALSSRSARVLPPRRSSASWGSSVRWPGRIQRLAHDSKDDKRTIIEETKRELGPNLASGWTPGERLRRYAEDIIHGKARD
jgi:hypothetical protein